MQGMVIYMEAKLQTLVQIKAFLDGISEAVFRAPKEKRNQFIGRILKRFGFARTLFAGVFAKKEGLIARRPEINI